MSSKEQTEAAFSLDWIEEAEGYWEDFRHSRKRRQYDSRRDSFQSFINKNLPDGVVGALSNAFPRVVPAIGLDVEKPDGWQPWWVRESPISSLWCHVVFGVISPYVREYPVEYGLPYNKPNHEIWEAVSGPRAWPHVQLDDGERRWMTRCILRHHLWAHLTRAYESFVDETARLAREHRATATEAEIALHDSQKRHRELLERLRETTGTAREEVISELSSVEESMLELEEAWFRQRANERQHRLRTVTGLRETLEHIRVSLLVEEAAYWYFPGAFSSDKPMPSSYLHCCFLNRER
jgi:hypothetical protein